jgi:hypothetical protein
MVNRENMGRHLRRIHGLDPTQAVPIVTTRAAPVPTSASLLKSGIAAGYFVRDGLRYTRCGACQKEIRSERFLVHIEICPSLTKRSKLGMAPYTELTQSACSIEIRQDVEQTPAAVVMQACPVCGCIMRPNKMRRHQQRVHAGAIVQHPALKVRRTAPAQKLTSAGNTLQRETRGLMDATRLVGYFARENGRFGSMPSYDDYSDEGRPD